MSSARGVVRAARGHALRIGARAGRVLPGAAGARARYLDLVARLDGGEDPAGRDREMREELERSSALFRSGDHTASLLWFDKALRIAYHPTLHYSESASPLTADPSAFLAPFRDSAVGRELFALPKTDQGPQRPAPRGHGGGEQAGAGSRSRSGEPTRLLVIAQRNWTFAEPVIEALGSRGFAVRRFEVDDLPADQRPTRERVLSARLRLALTGERLPTPESLREQFEWADTVLVEWGHHVLTWVSMLQTMPRRTVARFHRFEVYTPFPLLTVFPVVDRVLFVSPPVRSLLEHVTGNLASAGEIIEVDNFLGRGLGEEPDGHGDPHLLAQVGWVRPVKDVLFTLDLLARLRAEDPRYRLLLIGPPLPASADEDSFHERAVRERLAGFDEGAVEILGSRDDVPQLLAGAGWIISSSLVEAVHEAVMEGLAAGCVPIVRDWPDVRDYGGARLIYPEDWVVEDLEAATARVLGIQRTGSHAEHARAGRDWVVRRRSPDVVAERYVAALSAPQA
ncbi:hypothetical protein DEO23_15245 [Brachybacterium endophyticum]|uniref:Glycosyl transferase n=1 Tax=Brachybacterium endophyticum TaxID=2182385 RepID=A0A2U2RGJ3_9MICO|nr:glycosyltransferase [Brachybacterium endophyticum]PWH04989.1 hypothetical protein DEO23_15245 [Brachybacterium endophyticum]